MLTTAKPITEEDSRVSGYARLAVEVGLNLQPGQELLITAGHEHAPLVRALARAAYSAGAAYVDVYYEDARVRRALVELGPETALDHSPEWLVQRVEHIGETGGALLRVRGEAEPDVLAGLDGARVGKARMSRLRQATLRLSSEQLVNWCIVACPNPGWASAIYGEADVDRLWNDVAKVSRLDEPDPVAAWREHQARLRQRADSLNRRGFAAVRFTGPGTDLRVGLLPTVRWSSASMSTRAGLEFLPNLPTEEVFTSPDHRLTEGHV
ncbi:MAG TPA: aminopeptidase, partial [Candidatus Dormibacteraeota bacterium]|nr:aminopeptidase [Candidatus Dormibacteraeota bacterium]